MIMLSNEEFEIIVKETIEGLPEKFRNMLDERNIVIGVKDYPDPHDPPAFMRGGVLGFYHGVPMNKRGSTGYSTFPDRIVIYKTLIERYARTPAQIGALLRRVVLHEIGHFFGLSDAELRRLGY
jgi:predicted Zn-dependent protease with MMP-like domain